MISDGYRRRAFYFPTNPQRNMDPSVATGFNTPQIKLTKFEWTSWGPRLPRLPRIEALRTIALTTNPHSHLKSVAIVGGYAACYTEFIGEVTRALFNLAI